MAEKFIRKLEAILDRCLNSSGLLHQPHSPLFVAARDSA